MKDKSYYFKEATSFFDKAYEKLEQNIPEYTLITARKSLEALANGLCLQHNIDTMDSNGHSYSLDTLITQLISAGVITGENVEKVHAIRKNGNDAAHLSNKSQVDSFNVAHETLKLLASVLTEYAPKSMDTSPLQRICMAEEYAEAGKITKAETICQNILKEHYDDILLCARTLNCMCKFCGRNSEGILITSKKIDEWVTEGNEIAIAARLLERTIAYEPVFGYSAIEEIEIGQRVYGYVVGCSENDCILIDFGYKYIGFSAEVDGKKTGDIVTGTVAAQTEDGIRLSKVPICRQGYHAIVYAAMSEVKALFELLENAQSSVVPHFKKWIENKTPEYELACKLVPIAEEERLRQEELERLIRLHQEEEERANRQRREEAERINRQRREEAERINRQRREEAERIEQQRREELAKARAKADAQARAKAEAQARAKKKRALVTKCLAILCVVVVLVGILAGRMSMFSGGEGLLALNTKYVISTPEDFQKLVNADGTFQLKNDIDMNGAEMEPIEGFSGTLNGNGHTIRNVKIIGTENNTGFFEVLSGTVMNLNFEKVTVEVDGNFENVGILCGQLKGVVSNISVSGSVNAPKCDNVGGVFGFLCTSNSEAISNLDNKATVTGGNGVAGICGFADVENGAKWSNLDNSGTITASGDYVGGVFGQVIAEDDVSVESANNSGTITAYGDYVGGLCGYVEASSVVDRLLTIANCNNTANVSGASNVGGLLGKAYADKSSSTIINCTSTANVTGTYYVGGLAGRVSNITMVSCSNTNSTVTATDSFFEEGVYYAYVGGFAGRGYAFSDCTNEAPVDYTGKGCYVGGIAGYVPHGQNGIVHGLRNNASVSGADCVGGIFGKMSNFVEVSETENTGDITGSGSYVGGLFGQAATENDASIESATNSGMITAYGDYVGGLCGYVEASSVVDSLLMVTNCDNTGNVSGASNVGGLLGKAYADKSSSTIINCTSTANVTGTYYVGGLAGRVSNITMVECSNSGSTVTATGYFFEDGVCYAYVGGFAGRGYAFFDCTNEAPVNYTGKGCYVGGIAGYVPYGQDGIVHGLRNNASVSGADCVGGIFGGMSDFVEISETENTGDVTGTGSYVGGLFGQTTAEDDATVKTATNSGIVTATGDYVGGLFGYIKVYEYILWPDMTLTVTDCSNTGAIRGKSYVGGLFGYAYAAGSSTISNSTSSGEISGNDKTGEIGGKLVNITIE